jgi:hypothetical protein
LVALAQAGVVACSAAASKSAEEKLIHEDEDEPSPLYPFGGLVRSVVILSLVCTATMAQRKRVGLSRKKNIFFSHPNAFFFFFHS